MHGYGTLDESARAPSPPWEKVLSLLHLAGFPRPFPRFRRWEKHRVLVYSDEGGKEQSVGGTPFFVETYPEEISRRTDRWRQGLRRRCHYPRSDPKRGDTVPLASQSTPVLQGNRTHVSSLSFPWALDMDGVKSRSRKHMGETPNPSSPHQPLVLCPYMSILCRQSAVAMLFPLKEARLLAASGGLGRVKFPSGK